MESKESVKIMHFNRKQKMEKKMSIENLTAYEIVEDREIRDLNSRGVIPVSYTHLTLPTTSRV